MAFIVPVVRKDMQLYGRTNKSSKSPSTSGRPSSKSSPSLTQPELSESERHAMLMERRRVHRRRSTRLLSVSMSLRKISEEVDEDLEQARLDFARALDSSIEEEDSRSVSDIEEEDEEHVTASEESSQGDATAASAKKERISKRHRLLRLFAFMHRKAVSAERSSKKAVSRCASSP